jgi:phage tail-like protein
VATTTPARPRNPLRTYQFRIALLTPPLDADAAGRTFLGAEQGGGRTSQATGGEERYVAGVKRVSGLGMTVAASEVREGGNALHRYANPDRANWDPITLEQGLALDDTLERWAAAVVGYLRTGTVDSEEPVKRNLFVDVWDPAVPSEERSRRYLVFNAWISKFQAIPQLDATSSEVGLLVVELTHEGWRSDVPPTFETAADAAP